jgi:hypothetical protein
LPTVLLARRTTRSAAFLAVLLLTAACQGDPTAATDINAAPPPRLRVENDAAALAERIERRHETLGSWLAPAPVADADSAVARLGAMRPHSVAADPDVVTFDGVGETRPPVGPSGPLQATHAHFAGGFAYVAYAQIGEQAAGAVDVYDVRDPASPTLVSHASLRDSDVHTLAVSGDRLYLGTGAQDMARGETAVLEVLSLSGGRIGSSLARLPLPSQIVTGVTVAAGKVWVTTGTGGPREGGLTVLDAATLQPVAFDDFSDARAVAANGSSVVAVVRGTPGRVRLYDQASGRFLREFGIGGLSYADAKASIVSRATWAFVGAADAGVVLLQLRQNGNVTGTTVGGLPRPNRPELRPEYAVTNGVATAGDYVIAANGAAGVEVSHSTDQTTPQTSAPQLTRMGRLGLPDGYSANFVAASYPTVFVAAGTGGLRLLHMNVRPQNSR